jgi:hypothetical protein
MLQENQRNTLSHTADSNGFRRYAAEAADYIVSKKAAFTGGFFRLEWLINFRLVSRFSSVSAKSV